MHAVCVACTGAPALYAPAPKSTCVACYFQWLANASLFAMQVDVAKGIPPKVKTHLYVGMSEMQV